jgi:hypothetical protein
MFLHKSKVAAVVLALGLLGAGAGLLAQRALGDKPTFPAAQARSQPAGPSAAAEVSAVLKGVDGRKHTVTVQGIKQFSGEKTLELARGVKVLLSDGTDEKTGFREGKVGDLKEGALVTLRVSGSGQVIAIRVEGPTVQGILKAVDVDRRTITATVALSKVEAPADRTFVVARNVRLEVEGWDKGKTPAKKGPLADLPVGALVTLKLSVDGTAVGGLRAEGPTVWGSLEAVDAGKGTLTLTTKEGKKTFAVARGAAVELGGGKKKAQLADLPAGSEVTLRLSLDQTAALWLRAEGPTIHGAVKAVDARKNTLTVTTKVGERTFVLAREAWVSVDDHKAQLADLPVDAHIAVKLSADRKVALAVQAEGPGVEGVVKRDAGNASFTLAGKVSDQSYDVPAGARIVIATGNATREGKLTELIDGSVVSFRLSADRKTILGAIRAEGPTFQGSVKAVDSTGNTLILTVGAKADVEDRTFRTTRQTKVVTATYGVPRKLADVRPGQEVHLRLAIDQKSAERITVLGE